MVIFFLSGCQSDFEINTDYEEEMVVYCLLNAQDSVHYIRITRSVMNTKGESLDSVLLDPSRNGFSEPLEVTLEKWGVNGLIGYPIQFTVNHAIEQEYPLTHFGENSVYSASRTIDPGCVYRLFVTNPANGKTLTATCYTIDASNLHYRIENTYNSVTVDCLDSVYFYQTEMYFCFVEVSAQDTVYRRIPLFKYTLSNESKKAGATKELNMERPDIMQLIGNSIEPALEIKRYARKRPYEYRLVLGDEVLFDYQNTLTQFSQQYQSSQPITNICGGKGLFSSAYCKSLGSLYMLDYWYVTLSENKYTKNLNFQPIPWND